MEIRHVETESFVAFEWFDVIGIEARAEAPPVKRVIDEPAFGSAAAVGGDGRTRETRATDWRDVRGNQPPAEPLRQDLPAVVVAALRRTPPVLLALPRMEGTPTALG